MLIFNELPTKLKHAMTAHDLERGQILFQQLQPGSLTVPLQFSLKNLAIKLGLSPESLSRTLTQLEAENVLSRKKGSITFNEEWLNF